MKRYSIAFLTALALAGAVSSSARAATPCWLQPGDACVGDTGPQGPQGPQGETGAQGPAGPQGPQGETGAQGPQGEQGPQGVAGANGVDGISGINGTNGVDGAQGPKGDKGDKGDQGIAGRDGKDFDPGDMNEGLATIGALNIPHVDKRFAASLSGGFYDDKTAVGGGVAFKLDETWQFGGSIAVGTENGVVAGKAALTGQW